MDETRRDYTSRNKKQEKIRHTYVRLELAGGAGTPVPTDAIRCQHATTALARRGVGGRVYEEGRYKTRQRHKQTKTQTQTQTQTQSQDKTRQGKTTRQDNRNKRRQDKTTRQDKKTRQTDMTHVPTFQNSKIQNTLDWVKLLFCFSTNGCIHLFGY